ncbi:10176_t:CDS:2, partial [Racocetra fulgida]
PLGTNEYPALDIIPLGTFISLRNAAAQQKTQHLDTMAAFAGKQTVRPRDVYA